MELNQLEINVLNGILCLLSRLKFDEVHDIISSVIVDYLDEIGFQSELEFNRPYKIMVDDRVKDVDGRVDFYGFRDNIHIIGEVETSRIPTKTIRKLSMSPKHIKLLILLKKACGYAYISPYIHHLNKYLIIPLKAGHFIRSDIDIYHSKLLKDFLFDEKPDYLPVKLARNFARVLPEPKYKGW